jgi:hypothetical protein
LWWPGCAGIDASRIAGYDDSALSKWPIEKPGCQKQAPQEQNRRSKQGITYSRS